MKRQALKRDSNKARIGLLSSNEGTLMTPSNGTAKTSRVQRTLFNLDTFQDVTLVKDFPAPAPVETVQDALARLGNDSKALMAIINGGLLAEERNKQAGDPNGWMELDEESGNVGGPFNGTVADIKKVNALVLTMAKTVFGYSKDLTNEQKEATKNQAKEFIQSTPKIREGLKTSAALTPESAQDATS